MRTLQRFATVCFLGAALAAFSSACSSSDPATTPGGAGAPGAAGAAHGGASAAGAPAAGGASGGLMGDATRGATAYNKMAAACSGCHGMKGEGGLGPNISSSKTAGIGNWTQPQFHTAVREAKNRAGTPLNSGMQPATPANVSDQEIADIYAWLMSMPAIDTVQVGTFCTSGVCTGTK